MTGTLLSAFGGVGLIMLGMTILTDGLRALAGDSLRRILSRFTGNPYAGALTGAAITAAMQSSTAVTVATVGLVGGGVLTFLQAIGVIFGANVGTTVTGWLVAVLGFKFDLQTALAPAVFLGALLRRYAAGRIAQGGMALAGFGLLFMGLGALKTGLAGLDGLLTPDSFPPDDWAGRALLMLIGAAMTVITQSSSAGVATALVALHGGTIVLPQAAALVIGMDVGTTASAALAALGGSTAMRRTGYAHVLLNLLTGLVAFFALDLLLELARRVSGDGGELALVAFHTGFNVAGVLLLLPFARSFARLVEKLVPERGPQLTAGLDESLLAEPSVAVDAALSALKGVARAQADVLARALSGEAPPGDAFSLAITEALETTRLFLDRIETAGRDGPAHARHRAAMHALDHMLRLDNRLGQTPRIAALSGERRLARMASMLAAMARRVTASGDFAPHAERLRWLRGVFRGRRDGFRAATIDAAAHDHVGTDAAILRLDAMRWLDRVAYHLWRIAVNFAESPDTPADVEDEAEG